MSKIAQLRAEAAGLLAEAERPVDAEDAQFGQARRGDQIPQELARRQGRLATLRAAEEQIEADAAEKAAAAARAKARSKGSSAEDGEQAAAEAAAKAEPKPRMQRSFTDPQARIMRTNHGFGYAFNAQAAVDEDHQIVLAASVTQQATDVQQFEPMMACTAGSLAVAGIDQTPDVVLVDAGYCSETNLAAASAMPSRVLIATCRQRHDETFLAGVAPSPPPPDTSRREQMAHALRTEQGRADDARRKAIVEPVFGQMKTRQNAGRLRLRGLSGAQGEWLLHTLCHNLRKLRNATIAGIVPA